MSNVVLRVLVETQYIEPYGGYTHKPKFGDEYLFEFTEEHVGSYDPEYRGTWLANALVVRHLQEQGICEYPVKTSILGRNEMTPNQAMYARHAEDGYDDEFTRNYKPKTVDVEEGYFEF